MDIASIRQQYPQYGDMSDDDLANALHAKFYSDMPLDQFAQKIGYAPKQTQQAPDPYEGVPDSELSGVVAQRAGAPAINDQLNAAARGFANLGTFGQADKIAAVAGGATGIQGKYGAPVDNIALQQAATQEAKEQQPLTYNTGGAMGLLASPVNKVVGAVAGKVLPIANAAGEAAPVLQRYGNYGLQSGAINALYQAGMGHKDKAAESAAGGGAAAGIGMVAPEGSAGPLLEGVKDFGKGALMGVGGAAGAEIGSEIVGSVVKPIALSLGLIAPEEQAVAKLNQALERGGLTPDMLAAKDAKLGPDGMLANVGGPVTDYARDVAQFPGEARNAAQTGLSVQQGGRLSTTGGAPGRIEQALASTLSDQSAADTAKALIDQRTQESSPIWKDLFSEPVVPQSKKLDVMANNPVVRRAMSSGQATATNFANSVGDDLPATAFAADGKPTLQGWHAVTSNLGETISDVRRGVIPTPPDASLASLEALHSSIMGELKDEAVNPLAHQFEDALNTWSGPSAALDAMQMGAKVARGDARLTSQLVSDMTDNERQFFRIGLADQAQYLVSKTPDGANVVKSIFGNQNQRRNLEAAFESRSDFNQFRAAIARDQKFYSSGQTILGGSQTTPRALGAEDAASQVGEVAKGALEDAKEGGITGAVAGIAKRGMSYLKAEPEAVRDASGKMLFTTDPAEKAKVIAALNAQRARGTVFGSPGSAWIPRLGTIGMAKFMGAP